VDELDTDLIPKGGSNIAAAIRTCEEAFGKAEGFSRAIVIVSDGEELDADGLEAARQAAANNVRIFTVGVGSEEGSEIPLGPGEFVRDASGKVVQSRLDASRMTEIAEITGGFYVPLDEDAARRLVADGIGQMKEVEMSASASRRPIERYQWPLSAAIVLLALQALVGERRRRPALAVACWFLAAGSAWSAPAGLTAYEQGDYETARSAFEQRLRMEPDAPDLQMNAGTAAYRLKDFGKASEYFSRAMLSEDPALRSAAEFNLGNTLFRQGEGQEDKEKKVTDWKDAIAKYDAALKTRPDYTEAKENKERVEELLKQLEQEQKKDNKKDQKKDQQQKDQQQKKDEQQQGGDQKKEDQQQGGGQKDQEQQQGGGGQKDQQQKDQQKQDQQQQQGGGGQKDQEQQQKDQQQKKDEQQQGGDQKKEDQQQGGQQQKEQQPSADGGRKEQEQSGQQQKDQQQQGGGGQKDEQQEGEGKKEEGQQGQQQKDQQQQGSGGKEEQDKEGQQGKDQQQQGGGGKEDQDKEGEQKKDQQQQGGGGQQDKQQKDGEGREGEEKKEGGKKPGEQKQQQGGEGDEEKQDQPQGNQGSSAGSRPEPGKAGDKPAPVPQQAGDKKQGELRGGAAGERGDEKKEGAAAMAVAEEEEEGKMSASQARALLRSLQSEEEQVDLRERQNFQDVIRDW
jgi:Ca-activated chloride channel family protein